MKLPHVVAVSLLGCVAAVGCNAILGIDGDVNRLGPAPVVGGGGSAGAGGGSGGNIGGGGSGGSGGSTTSCVVDEQCDPITAQCKFAECIEGMCGIGYKGPGTACTENDGTVCDGMGTCIFDPGAVNGEPCFEGSDCASDFCVDGMCCGSACTADCNACVGEDTGKPDGECQPIISGTDPFNDCVEPELCNGWGACDRGVHMWSRHYSGAGNQVPNDVAIDAATGDAIVVGHIEGATDLGGGQVTAVGTRDGFVARYDHNGAHVWSFTFGAANLNAAARAVDVSALGEIYVTGYFEGSVTFPGQPAVVSAGGRDAFLLRLSSLGAGLNAQRFGGNLDEEGATLDAIGNDNVIVGGHFSSSIDPCAEGPLQASGANDSWVAMRGSHSIPPAQLCTCSVPVSPPTAPSRGPRCLAPATWPPGAPR
jgi:hypothetical protein